MLAWLLPLLVLLALAAWDAAGRIQRSLELSSHYGVAVRAPALDPGSPTGYRLERRSLILPQLGPDTQHWIMQTQAMAAQGAIRVRHVDYDNAPEGRAVHWAAPYRAWLLGLAHLDRLSLGTPLPLAIERSALWAGPAMLAVALMLAVPLLARRHGAWAAFVFAAGLVGCTPLAVHFAAGNADHHGAATLLAVATVLLLLPGRRHGGAVSPAHPVASALAGALGLWISATTLVPVLLGIGLGVLGATLAARRTGPAAPPSHDPAAWRRWGAAGGAATLVAWLCEYAPAGSGWRLEVIHPLHAVAWAAGGEWLHRAQGGGASGRRRPWVTTACAALVALPGVLIAVLGARVYQPLDTLLLQLHGRYIAEFQGIGSLLARHPADLRLWGMLAPIVLGAAAAALALRGRLSPAGLLPLGLCTGPAVGLSVAAGLQVRWWGAAAALSLVVAIVALGLRLESAPKRIRTVAWIAAALALGPGLLATVRTAQRAAIATGEDIRLLALRDVAHRLRLRSAGEPLVIAAPPESTTHLIHYGGARGLGTLYWENRAGLARAAELFSAQTDETALEQVRRAGVTHIVLPSWDPGQEHLVRLDRQLAPDAPLPAAALAARLQADRPPSWLRPVAHRLPDHPLLRSEIIRIHEVVAPRSPARIAVDDTAWLLDMGRTEEAARMEPALARFPADLAAQTMLAVLQARRRDARAFGDTLRRLPELLPDAGQLPLGIRLQVVSVLAIGGRGELATAQLRAALASADEASIRRLSAGGIADLLELTEALGAAFPDEGLHRLARELDMRPPR